MIRVLLHYTPNWKEIANITIPIAKEYCKKHGYKFSAYDCIAYGQYDGKEKLNHILYEWKAGDVCMVMDADTMITNHGIKIEDFIDDSHDLYISKHVGNINAGIFIIRLTEWSKRFLRYVLDNIGQEKIYCEQDAIAKYRREHPHDSKIKIVEHPAFNSLKYELYPEHGIQKEEDGQWVEGKSFVLHLPGIGQERRLEILKNTPVIL